MANLMRSQLFFYELIDQAELLLNLQLKSPVYKIV